MSIDLGNKKWFVLICFVIVGMVGFSSWGESEDELPNMPEKVDFSYHIQPILSQNCYTCHGNDPSTRKAGLRLDIEEDAKATLESGSSAIVAGSIKKSALINRILSHDPDVQMPPPEAKKTLTEREIALLKKWIKQGAKYQDHWAFTKPKLPTLPNGSASNMSDVIDHFITDKINYKKLSKVNPASKNELIRRVAFLTTGLPPSLAELQNFIDDDSDEAYSKMINQYLTSPAYGERWARHWMDLVRYGESMGHEMDFDISNAYEYRDYLIRAFNEDVPYDMFVKEHLAGDMLTSPRVNLKSGFNESHIGTGYFFLGEGKHSPVDPKVEELDKIDNMIDVTSKTFQAMTVACAKCHDHKFDPIPASDYYAMYGMIESSRLMPKPARFISNLGDQFSKIYNIKEHAKSDIISFIENLNDSANSDIGVSNQYKTINIKNDTSATLLAEFRDGNWDGWFIEGRAFGKEPVKGGLAVEDTRLYREQEVVNKRRDFKTDKLFEAALSKAQKPRSNDIQTRVLSGFASSRNISSGLQGVLHGPNFIIEHDSIAVRARGLNGTVRVIIENFQVVQNPLWGGCEKVVSSPEWKTYKLDVHLAKGHKAYLEFLPGKYNRHVYSIEPDDYIEIQWAAAYSGDHGLVHHNLEIPIKRTSQIDKVELTNNWSNGDLNVEEASELDRIINTKRLFKTSKKLNGDLQKLKKEIFDPTHFIGLAEGEAIESPIFIRGSHKELSDEKIPHQFLSAVDIEMDFPQEGSGRLAWANALINEDNPLTSRVIVNRIWHHLFGRGIVETVDNFGLQGKIPSHPELLDYLAIKFVEDGWSIKNLIKNIMLSETFMRSTQVNDKNKQVDPDNIYLSSFPIRRLESEAIRDGMLAVAGCLDDQMYGEGVPVYLSEFMTGRGRPGQSGPLDSYGRRSIYRQVRRNFVPEMMLTFDMPIPFSTFGKRNTTNVPAQSLTLMNNPFVHEQASYWAENLISSTENFTIEERIQRIYLKAFSREPNQEELSQGIRFIEEQANSQGNNPNELVNDPMIWKEYCHLIFNFKEFIHLI